VLWLKRTVAECGGLHDKRYPVEQKLNDSGRARRDGSRKRPRASTDHVPDSPDLDLRVRLLKADDPADRLRVEIRGCQVGDQECLSRRRSGEPTECILVTRRALSIERSITTESICNR